MNKYMAEISVIVPVYQVEERLPRCIESVLAQSFMDFELLLVDDGSLDRSGEICDMYAKRDNRIRVFHQGNAGVSAARNRGLEVATGRYIVFIDSDDYVRTEYLENLYVSLNSVKNAGSGIAISGITIVTVDETVKRTVEYVARTVLDGQLVSFWESNDMSEMRNPVAKIYDKKVLDEHRIRFDTRIHFGEDSIFVFEYLLWCNYIVVTENIDYVYWEKDGSLSKKVNDFESEYAAFCRYHSILMELVHIYGLSLDKMGNAYYFSLLFFQRALRTDYYNGGIPKKQRLRHLEQLIVENYRFVIDCYRPAYKLDKLGRRLLLRRWLILYDLLFVMLFKWKVQCVFMPKQKEK